MSGFIEIKSEGGRPCYININSIRLVANSVDGCKILFSPDGYICPTESYDEVIAMIKKEGAE